MKSLDLKAAIGTRYHRLLITAVSDRTKQYKNTSIERFLIAQCDCGVITEVSVWQLRSGHTKSCGCLAKETRRKYPAHIAAAKYLLKGYKGNAKSRGYYWSLTLTDFMSLIERDCTYCGTPAPLKQLNRTNKEKHWTPEWEKQLVIPANGIDRVNNTLGYTPDNCIPCCTSCNMMKRNMTFETFIQQCKRIASKYTA